MGADSINLNVIYLATDVVGRKLSKLGGVAKEASHAEMVHHALKGSRIFYCEDFRTNFIGGKWFVILAKTLIPLD